MMINHGTGSFMVFSRSAILTVPEHPMAALAECLIKVFVSSTASFTQCIRARRTAWKDK